MQKIKDITQDVRFEAFIFATWFILVLMDLLKFCNLKDVNFYLSIYFTGSRISALTDFFSITIGIYIAITSILAVSVIGISKKMLEKRLDERLLKIIFWGLISNLVLVGISIFIPITIPYFCITLLSLNIISISLFIKFFLVILIIFRGNMDKMAEDIEDEEKFRNGIYCLLDDIKNNTKKP